MSTILIAEDDDAIRGLLVRLLRHAGYDTVDCANGALALAQARRSPPDVVLSDVAMPEMDGYALVEALRADATLAATPVLLLTALDERASMRRGMAAGADDFLAKPFASAELLEAVATLLKKRERLAGSIESAVAARVAALRGGVAAAGAGVSQRPDEYGLAVDGSAVVEGLVQATVLFADIRNFTALAEALSSAEVAELLAAYFEHACEPVLANGGRSLKFIGDGLMSLFADDAAEGVPAVPAPRRAIAAALGIAVATHRFRDWVDQRFAGLPPFAIGVGLHAGEVTLCCLGTGQNAEITPIGDTVNVAARLESASKELGWTVVASAALLQRAGAGVQTGGAASLALRGRSENIDVVEITGLAAGGQQDGFPAAAHAVRTAVEVNSAIAAGAPDGSPVTVVTGRRGEAGEG